MRKLLFIIAAILAWTCGYSTVSNHADKLRQNQRTKHYANEFFSIDYPISWEGEEFVNDARDSFPNAIGYRIELYAPYRDSGYLTVSVQKSTYPNFGINAKDWRDLTAMMKFRQSGFLTYFALVDSLMIDSVEFGECQAAMAGFLAVTEFDDTVIHKQTIIIDDSLVYYLNNIYGLHSNDTLRRKGDAILSSFRLRSHHKKR